MYFAYDEWEDETGADPEWSRQHARDWLEDHQTRGYAFSGFNDQEEAASGTFRGLYGTLQPVYLINSEVVRQDEKAGLFSVSARDKLPSEYVLRAEVEAVIELPEGYEPRLLDPARNVHPATEAAGWAGNAPHRGGPPRAGHRYDDAIWGVVEQWTNRACDSTVERLKRNGWTVGCQLPGSEGDGWHDGLWGRTAFYLATRTRPGSRRTEGRNSGDEGIPALPAQCPERQRAVEQAITRIQGAQHDEQENAQSRGQPDGCHIGNRGQAEEDEESHGIVGRQARQESSRPPAVRREDTERRSN